MFPVEPMKRLPIWFLLLTSAGACTSQTVVNQPQLGVAPAPAPAPVTAANAGTLNWPVEGELIYRFGREERPNGTVLRREGIGIRAATGAPIQAVEAGTVAFAGPFEGYGLMVMLRHGGGFYTLYLYLEDIGVTQGREVAVGQVVGTVGGADTPEGPHIEFQVRAPTDHPRALDPLTWLRAQ